MTVALKVYNRGDNFRAKRWPDHARLALERLWPTHTGSEISELLAGHYGLKFSRCAVCGKAHKLNLKKAPISRETVLRRKIAEELFHDSPGRNKRRY